MLIKPFIPSVLKIDAEVSPLPNGVKLKPMGKSSSSHSLSKRTGKSSKRAATEEISTNPSGGSTVNTRVLDLESDSVLDENHIDLEIDGGELSLKSLPSPLHTDLDEIVVDMAPASEILPASRPPTASSLQFNHYGAINQTSNNNNKLDILIGGNEEKRPETTTERRDEKAYDNKAFDDSQS